MKIAIGYPPLESSKGVPQISQNRQFQWTTSGIVSYAIYPVIPAYAASLLKEKGYQVYWLDGIAEKQTYEQWESKLLEIKPDILAIETKTPVIKYHWAIVNKLKAKARKCKIVLMGDHVTALSEETMENCPADFVIKGGDYDFGLLSIANHLSKKEKLEAGIWYRNHSSFSVHGSSFKLNHSLDELPPIDRDLTKWQLYAYKNSNFYRAPGAYTMFGRDCWWGRCTFCVGGKTQIFTKEGLLPIKEIVDKKQTIEVLTHTGSYKKVIDWYKRKVDEEIIEVSPLYFPYNLEVTKNHKVFCLLKAKVRHCSYKNGWAYSCKPNRKSKFLDCKNCPEKYFNNYALEEIEAEKLKKGDFVAFPIDRKVKDINFIDVKEVLEKKQTVFITPKKITKEQITAICLLAGRGYSQRRISRELKLDRETVNRYLLLEKKGQLDISLNQYSQSGDGISFKFGVNKIKSKILAEPDFFYLVGLYLAEGHTTSLISRPNSAVLGFTFNKNESCLIKKAEFLFKEYFGVSLNSTVNKKNNTCQLYIGSAIIARFFDILFGHDCYHKNVPFEFLELPLEKQRFLLRGLFNGDGHLRKREDKDAGAEYIFETTSKQLAEQVFLMLLRFNAIPGFKVLQPGRKELATKYKITLFQEDISKVFPDIKFSEEKVTYKRGMILGNYALVPITKLKRKSFNDYVYNLTVKDDHSYVANFLTVRNCSWTTLFPGEKYRVMSVKQAIAEVENLVENYRAQEIMDDSGTFPVGDWLREFCREIIKRGYQKKVRFNCNMRFNSGLTQKDYDLMSRAGFRFILYGLESANQLTLDRLNKNLKVDQIEPSLAMAKKAGLKPHVTVMVGYPWEGEAEILNTVNFTKSLFRKGLVDSMQATVVIPYPGTPLFQNCLRENCLKTLDWNRYDMRNPVMKTKMPEEKLLSTVRELYSSSIWNKTFIFNTLSQLTSLDGWKYVSFQGFKYLGKLLEFRN
ncbi:MAG: radical SAM protein [Patescibacteria group bacterium]|jgi:radical SAM superfamily enzyme YgiQ (UPF0313 family)